MSESQNLPELPEIGHPEIYYAKRVVYADRHNNPHLREAAKVGQYLTLATGQALGWAEKLKYFQHALRRHCNPPPLPTEPVWLFYRQLADLVRRHAGQEALRLALAEDELYVRRQRLGQLRVKIVAEAKEFFGKLLPTERCPDYLNDEDFRQLKMIRDQWT